MPRHYKALQPWADFTTGLKFKHKFKTLILNFIIYNNFIILFYYG